MKKYVLVCMRNGGKLFVLHRDAWNDLKGLGAPFYESKVVAESDEMLSLMRFKSLTAEES